MLIVQKKIRLEGKVMADYIDYVVSEKNYRATSNDDLLMQIKDENPNTKDKSLQEYMDYIAENVINDMTRNKIKVPANSDDIVEAWERLGVLQTKDNSFQEKVGGMQSSHKQRFSDNKEQRER